MFRLTGILVLAFGFLACTSEEERLKQQVAENYADLVYANYDDAVKAAEVLKSAVDNFLAEPTAESFELAKQAWIASRPPYLQTEAFRFYDGPIDGPQGLEGYINAWPLDEHFIDYVRDEKSGKPIYKGIINDTVSFPVLSLEILIKENEIHGEADVKIGFHAIEFLLWGQDVYPDSPGRRPYSDYLTGPEATAPNGDRRRMYLSLVTDLLVQHLKEVRDAWDTRSAYRTEFLKKNNINQSLISMLAGLGKLSKGELAGERMTVALENKDQEDEHSCFSDNTHNDMIYNQIGIENVYMGNYRRADGSSVAGTGLATLVGLKNATLAEEIQGRMKETLEKIKEIPVPFDQAIIYEPEAVQDAIRSLRQQSDDIQRMAEVIGLKLVIPETNE